MLKIRLKRVGRKHDASYRMIVTEAGRGVSSNKFVDLIGSYDPRTNRKDIDAAKAKDWISKGAQPSDTVFNLLIDAGAIEARKKNVLPKKSAPVVEKPAEAEVKEQKEEAVSADTAPESDSKDQVVE